MIDEQKFLPLKRFVHKGLRSLMGSLGEKEAGPQNPLHWQLNVILMQAAS